MRLGDVGLVAMLQQFHVDRAAGQAQNHAVIAVVGTPLRKYGQSKDIAVVQGISLVLVAAFVVVNLLVDVAYALLDPRVTLGTRAQ